MDQPQPHRVAVLALPGVVAFDMTIPLEVFAGTDAPYSVRLVTADGAPVTTSSGYGVTPHAGPEAFSEAQTVVVPGFWPTWAPPPGPALELLRAAHDRGVRLVSICTGAFALAAAGVLDGRRATTHWRHTDELVARHPTVVVERDVLFVDEGDVLTSAGMAAGIDLCLHVVRRDHGARAAREVARRLVVAAHREGGQAQFVAAPVPDVAGGSLADTRAWALEHLGEAMTLDALAHHAHVSTRTLQRRWRDETGTSPLRWLSEQRVHRARELLEADPTMPVEEVARRTGLGTGDNLRLHTRRHLGTTPSAYRSAFGTPARAPRPPP
ncbi:GlxA family transcriptional regulator [Cellulomonas xiejunii]|uniref:DJ-1/PfpI family protein n=1 Tax=Cellulomonas xiejunii TaxID=2968083 RepID=A0ABY5KL14_9CELL|nr:DJ-1/PfpI family protein [Cellulomonas xiejunii]MCC2320140.1 DJ-1/PfpI family protein [Cellulomonas xiejunii]UUI70449.1 DJ-1/PfpI family protein [Cellulomonas xiejunii]